MTKKFIMSRIYMNKSARFARYCEVCLERRVEFGSAKSHRAAETNLAKPRKPRNGQFGASGLMNVGGRAHD